MELELFMHIPGTHCRGIPFFSKAPRSFLGRSMTSAIHDTRCVQLGGIRVLEPGKWMCARRSAIVVPSERGAPTQGRANRTGIHSRWLTRWTKLSNGSRQPADKESSSRGLEFANWNDCKPTCRRSSRD